MYFLKNFNLLFFLLFSFLKSKFWNYYFVGLMGLSTVISGTINYLYHPIMIRHLDGASFAMMQALLSLFSLMSIIAWWLSLYATQQFTLHNKNKFFVDVFVSVWIRWLSSVSVFGIFVVVLSSPFIAYYLHLPNIRPVVIVSISIFFSMVSVVYGSFLQSYQQFEHIAMSGIIGSVMRVLPWYGAILLWRGLYGTIGAVSFSSLFVLYYQYLAYRHIVRHDTQPSQIDFLKFKKDIIADFVKEWKSIGMFCLVSAWTVILVNADVFIVAHLFVGQQAGDYTAISVLSKFLLFLGTALESVYYPQLANKNIIDISIIQLRNYLVLVLLLIITALLWSYFVGPWVLYLYKSHLVTHHILLVKLVFVSGGLFICTTFIKLFIAWRKQYEVLWILWVWTIGLLLLQSSNLSLDNFVLFYILLIMLLCWYVFVSLIYFLRWVKKI